MEPERKSEPGCNSWPGRMSEPAGAHISPGRMSSGFHKISGQKSGQKSSGILWMHVESGHKMSLAHNLAGVHVRAEVHIGAGWGARQSWVGRKSELGRKSGPGRTLEPAGVHIRAGAHIKLWVHVKCWGTS